MRGAVRRWPSPFMCSSPAEHARCGEAPTRRPTPASVVPC